MTDVKPFNFDFQNRRLSYGDENKEMYTTLTRVMKSPFYQANYTKIFIAAMSLGYKKDSKKKLKKRENALHGTSFTPEEKWLMISLYMKNNTKLGVHALFNPDDIFNLAEEYANGGIEFLYNIYNATSEPVDELEKEFRKYLK